jgi:osmoprotectant transport system permease protein
LASFPGALRFIAQHTGLLLSKGGQTILLSAASMAIALVVGLPLGLWLGHRGRGSFVVLALANALRALPSLALIAIMLAFLGLGFLNVTVALVVLAIPPILTNAFVGIAQVPADVVDAARGMGTAPLRVLLDVELPLALPLVFGGIRTATVFVVATTPLGAIAGGGGLGDIIVNQPTYGLQGVLGAAITLAALAFATDFILGTLERALVPRGLRPRERRAAGGRWQRRADIEWPAATGDL